MILGIQRISATFFVLMAIGFGADKALAQGHVVEKAPLLVGAWEYAGPVTVDCETRQPNGPDVRVSLLFNQGGTMFVEDTFPLEGPYRTTGPGVWKRETNGEFSYAHMHYSFAPDNTFLYTIKQRSRLRLSSDRNSYTEKGTFQGIAQAGTVLFTGCFEGTTNRVVF